MLWINLLFFVMSCAVLVIAGSILVKSLVKIAGFLNLSEYVVAFIIMAFATSIPELFVGITSALARNTALTLGTVIGSNIADIALVGGMMILLARGIKIKSKKITKDSLFVALIATVPLVLFFIGKSISRIDGGILLVIFVFYSWYLIKRRKKFRVKIKEKVKKTEIIIWPVLFIIAIVLLYFSAEAVVEISSMIAFDLALPPIIIGLFFIAIGTSLPELVFELRAVLMHHPDMALGDLLGSVAANSTLVLGITALIWPITANITLFFVSGIFMILILFLFATFITSGNKLYIIEGVALLLLYVFFIILQLYLQGTIRFAT